MTIITAALGEWSVRRNGVWRLPFVVNLCVSNNSENLLARSVIKSLLGQNRALNLRYL